MSVLKKELADINAQIEALEARKQDIYKASLEASEEDKVCNNVFAYSLASSLAPSRLSGINYPIEVTGVNWGNPCILPKNRKCQLVAIRQACNDKTYVGIHVGDFPLGIEASYHPDSGVLSLLNACYNPAVVIPDLGKVVMGYEAWWRRIRSEEQLKEITDGDIQNTWYVELLNVAACQKKGKE